MRVGEEKEGGGVRVGRAYATLTRSFQTAGRAAAFPGRAMSCIDGNVLLKPPGSPDLPRPSRDISTRVRSAEREGGNEKAHTLT